VLVAHHDGGGEVVAVEQFVFGAGQVVLAVSPGGFGVGAVAAFGGGRAGEGLQVGPVHCQRRAGVLELGRDGCLEQVIADRLQRLWREAVGLVFAEGAGNQAEGALGLPVGQLVRAVFAVRDHPHPHLVMFGEADQGLAHAGQVGGPVIGQDEQAAGAIQPAVI
jgi:hypothetical protein